MREYARETRPTVHLAATIARRAAASVRPFTVGTTQREAEGGGNTGGGDTGDCGGGGDAGGGGSGGGGGSAGGGGGGGGGDANAAVYVAGAAGATISWLRAPPSDQLENVNSVPDTDCGEGAVTVVAEPTIT